MTLSKKVLLIALILSILLTLFFIFSNSMKSPDRSMEESNNATDKIEEVVSPETSIGAFLSTYLRKIAHFLEFALLGYEVFLLVSFYFGLRPAYFVSSLLFGVLTAVLDETVQITSGRGSSVIDVWIDVSGYFFAAFAGALLFAVIRRIKTYRGAKR